MAFPDPLHTILRSCTIVDCSKGEIARRVYFGDRGKEEGAIHTLELCVINDVGVEIDVERLQHPMDVLHSDSRIVRVVEVRGEHTKTVFLARQMEHVRGVAAAADAYDYVVPLATTVLLHSLNG